MVGEEGHTIVIDNCDNGPLDASHLGTWRKFCQLNFEAFILFLFLKYTKINIYTVTFSLPGMLTELQVSFVLKRNPS